MSALSVRWNGQEVALERAAAELRAAQRSWDALGFAARAEHLATLGRYWAADRDDVWEALQTSLGSSAPMLQWGFRQAMECWTPEALLALVQTELGDAPSAAPTLCGMVLASTVPPAGLQSVVLALLGGSAVCVRPARRLQGLFEAFLDSLETLCPEVAEVLAVATFDWEDSAAVEAFVDPVDVLVVHGSAETVARWRAVAGPRPLVAYGHRVSAAWVGRHVDAADVAEAIAWDLCAWDQSGCLSPQVLFVEGASARARALAEAVCAALPAVEAALPMAPLSPAEHATREQFIRARMVDADVLRATSGAVLVVHDAIGPLESSCGARVLLVRPAPDREALLSALTAASPHLQCLGAAGLDDETHAQVMAVLTPHGLNRICALGEMQQPDLTWIHDGIGSLAPLRGR